MPSDLHIELSNCALTWIGARATGRGIRAAREIWVAEKYVVDAAALASFQYRYEKAYLHGQEHEERYGEWACLFEVKASRADFISTFGDPASNRRQPQGHLHWVVTPRRLVSPEEVPEPWGLLEIYGSGLRELKSACYCPQPIEQLYKLAYSILWATGKRRQQPTPKQQGKTLAEVRGILNCEPPREINDKTLAEVRGILRDVCTQ